MSSKITAYGNCSHEIKRHLLLGRKAMINLDSTLKNKDITLPTKVHLVKALVFPVVTYGCESWTVKEAECWKFDAFELWCWIRLLRISWFARRSNQSILKEINPENSLEGLLEKLQYFGHLMRRADSLEKTLVLRKIESKRRGVTDDAIVREHHWLYEHEFEQTPEDSGGQRSLACYNQPMGQTGLSNWTVMKKIFFKIY